MTASVLRQ